ncbi:MAG: methylenetetrahydrofolate reductase [NAD(P)H] [Cryomorphaceae bacterium]
MKVTEHIEKATKTLFSIEVLPPLKGQTIHSIYATMDKLMPFDPAFVDVTYHRQEVVYREVEKGLMKRHAVRKRPGTVGICASLMNKYDIDTVPHIICGGFSKDETEDALIDLNFLGIENVLVLRGDPVKSEGIFKPEPDGHAYASDLLQQVVQMNEGKYLDEELRNSSKTNFCIGVAGYPEKHYEAPNFKSDMKFLKKKVELGAEYIVTQLFYDNAMYFDFVKKCRAAGIEVPIIPGLKPITSKKQLNIVPHFFHVNLPEALVDAIEDAKTDEQVRKEGVKWCIQQSEELIDAGVPVMHYYTMGKAKSVQEVAQAVFGQ